MGDLRTHVNRLVLFLTLSFPASVLATVPYPAYDAYQAQIYERHAIECMTRLGLQPSCVRLLETALEFNPNRASSHFALGTFYLRTGDASRALAELSSALRLQPDMQEAVLFQGDIHASQGKLSRAEEKYRQYVSAVPADPRGYLGLASLAAQRGDEGSAVALLQHAMDRGFTDLKVLLAQPAWKRLKDRPAVRLLLQSEHASPP